jgi:SAM-dependent methyltransferase
MPVRIDLAMSTVSEHYETLLAHHYSWMFNQSFEEKVAEQRKILEEVLPAEKTAERDLAVDLGAGPGFQSIALAELGFSRIIAIDTSEILLKELEAHRKNHPIQTHQADLRDLQTISAPGQANVILCMGDTLTHLPSKDDVDQLFHSASNALTSGGSFILTFRDLTTDLHGTDRFLPIRSGPDKIMTCFLEFESSETVRVHDLIHVHSPSGWNLQKSSYTKLRLSPTWVAQRLVDAGFSISAQKPAGRLHLIAARKP